MTSTARRVMAAALAAEAKEKQVFEAIARGNHRHAEELKAELLVLLEGKVDLQIVQFKEMLREL